MEAAPECVSVTFDESSGLATKITGGFCLDRGMGNTGPAGGIWGVLQASRRFVSFCSVRASQNMDYFFVAEKTGSEDKQVHGLLFIFHHWVRVEPGNGNARTEALVAPCDNFVGLHRWGSIDTDPCAWGICDVCMFDAAQVALHRLGACLCKTCD